MAVVAETTLNNNNQSINPPIMTDETVNEARGLNNSNDMSFEHHFVICNLTHVGLGVKKALSCTKLVVKSN